MRLVAFDYFRAIAILIVVVGHSYGPWSINSFSERVFANIITGGTSLFVFISGFFFHYVFYDNFNYRGFLKKKLAFIFVPYAILSSIGIVYYLSTKSPLPFSDILKIEALHSWADYLEMLGIYLWTGRISGTFWYVPFIIIIFTLSPLFIKYIELPKAYRNVIFLLLLIVSLIVHRPAANLSPIHSVLYFMPVYLLGIICSMHSEFMFKFIRNKTIIIGLIVLLIAILQALLQEGYGNRHKLDIFSYRGIDIIIIQKIVLCFFFLSLFQKYEDRKIPALTLLASASFAIFFIHLWCIKLLVKSGAITFFNFLPEFLVFVLTALIAVIGSLLIAYSVKLGLKKYSRFVIGW